MINKPNIQNVISKQQNHAISEYISWEQLFPKYINISPKDTWDWYILGRDTLCLRKQQWRNKNI